MTGNPEFKKNLWLEFSKGKVISLLLIYLGVYAVTFAVDEMDIINNLNKVSFVAVVLLVYLWGTKKAADAVIEEFNDRTWDDQRLTLLTPTQMTIGKLFGTTSFTWFAGLISLLVLFFTSFDVHGAEDAFKLLITIIFSAVGLHSFVMSLSIMDMRKNRNRKKMNSNLYFIFGLLLAFGAIVRPLGIAIEEIFMKNTNYMKWYFIKVDNLDIMLMISLFLGTWAIIGLYRNIRLELHFDKAPYFWMGFIVSSGLFFSGYIDVADAIEMDWFLTSIMIFLGMNTIGFYFAAFFEDKYIIRIKERIYELKNNNKISFVRNQPLFLFNLAFGILIALTGLVYGFTMIETDELYGLLPLAVLTFMFRDIFVILWVNFSKSKRPDMTAFIYLISIYLIPTLFSFAIESKEFQAVFFPVSNDLYWISIIAGLLQSVIAYVLMSGRYKNAN